jgi:hypothetical protein
MQLFSQYPILQRFPVFELSYETVSHKKVLSQHPSVGLAVPVGRKYFLWHTFDVPATPATYLVGLDKDKRLISAEKLAPDCISFEKHPFHYGTVLYGTMVSSPSIKQFVAEDIYWFCGNPLLQLPFSQKIQFLKEYVETCRPLVLLPVLWFVPANQEFGHEIPLSAETAAYTPHHLQYRELDHISPYVNILIPKRGCAGTAPVVDAAEATKKLTTSVLLQPVPRFDFRRPQYRFPAVFQVVADPQLDIYHLYAQNHVYCGLAGIQTLQTSMFMNSLFRKIRENSNLDLAEESEDEEDFENIDCNKFVFLDRELPIRCVFNTKHRKWIPVEVANGKELVHIKELTSEQVNNNNNNHHHRPAHQFAPKHGGCARNKKTQEQRRLNPYPVHREDNRNTKYQRNKK